MFSSSSSSTVDVPTDTLGLRPLWPNIHDRAANKDFDFDIISIHGLGGDSRRTWTHVGKEYNTLWLRDLLPQDLADLEVKARILTFGYAANLFYRSSGQGSETFADDLLRRLQENRVANNAESRPIFWVVHSLGGIVLKAALSNCRTRGQDLEYMGILNSTKGIIFLGTPHSGVSDIAGLAAFLSRVVNSLQLQKASPAARELSLWSDDLLRNAMNFRNIADKLRIWSFYETRNTHGVRVVEKGSTFLNSPGEKSGSLDGNHHEICKFESRSSNNYQNILSAITMVVTTIKEEKEALRREQEMRPPTQGDLFNWAWQSVTNNPPLQLREIRPTDVVNGQPLGNIGAQMAQGQQFGYAAVQQMVDQYRNIMNPPAPTPSVRLGPQYGGARQRGCRGGLQCQYGCICAFTQ
ncbi:hypothetical protein BGZ60DRAFT_532612 [Tricladium varicosporioides]|nr:hypothetical protein BGZ60DRAFT_532612 [Hymenoscyphus varicosporioides]